MFVHNSSLAGALPGLGPSQVHGNCGGEIETPHYATLFPMGKMNLIFAVTARSVEY
jgi:hypothetical protein